MSSTIRFGGRLWCGRPPPRRRCRSRSRSCEASSPLLRRWGRRFSRRCRPNPNWCRSLRRAWGGWRRYCRCSASEHPRGDRSPYVGDDTGTSSVYGMLDDRLSSRTISGVLDGALISVCATCLNSAGRHPNITSAHVRRPCRTDARWRQTTAFRC
jgi:hypothetical protein